MRSTCCHTEKALGKDEIQGRWAEAGDGLGPEEDPRESLNLQTE